MNIVERAKDLLLEVGAAPILYLMIALSVISIAIIVERAWFFFITTGKVAQLARALDQHLGDADLGAAKDMVTRSRSMEAAIVAAGLSRFEHGPSAVEEAIASATALQRMRLERGLSFLGTLGNNAPFVGLLGTVIGIVQAFEQLERAGLNSGGAGAEVMGAIAEALVATAIGLAVAIPAVAAFNFFQRRIKTTLGNSTALSHILLLHAKSEAARGGPAPHDTASSTGGKHTVDTRRKREATPASLVGVNIVNV